jgi:hypothetical protein
MPTKSCGPLPEAPSNAALEFCAYAVHDDLQSANVNHYKHEGA